LQWEAKLIIFGYFELLESEKYATNAQLVTLVTLVKILAEFHVWTDEK